MFTIADVLASCSSVVHFIGEVCHNSYVPMDWIPLRKCYSEICIREVSRFTNDNVNCMLSGVDLSPLLAEEKHNIYV